jgi:predicted MFS family arabinose efflux permease
VPAAAHVPSVTLLAIVLLVTGLLGGSVNCSSGRAIMAWFREGERGFAMSIRQTAIPLGGGLGALVLPSLASAHGFAAVFGSLAAASAVSTVLAWRWLRQPPAGDDANTDIAATTSAGPTPLRNVDIWRIATAIGVLCFPQVAVLTFAAVFLHDFAGMEQQRSAPAWPQCRSAPWSCASGAAASRIAAATAGRSCVFAAP